MKIVYLKKFANYIIIGLLVGNSIIEVIQPKSLPSDTPNDQIRIHGVSSVMSGTFTGVNNTSNFTLMAVHRGTEDNSTPRLNNNGSSHYIELEFINDNLPLYGKQEDVRKE